MMTEKQFIESQKECAEMLGMSLSEYQNYCKTLKVPTYEEIPNKDKKNNTDSILEFLEIDKSLLKVRKD